MSLLLKLFTLVLTLVVCRIQVNPTLHSFIDSSGYTYIYHGTAQDNNEGTIHLTDIQLQQMQDWGFKAIRLGFHWHLYEYAPDTFNETYMDIVEETVDKFYSYGMMTFLDMHQDLWSPIYCGGHGIPEFYGYPYNETQYWKYNNATYPYPVHEPIDYVDNDEYANVFGKVGPNTCHQMVDNTTIGWASSYETYAIGAAAQRMYDDSDNIRHKFAYNFWYKVANRFKSNPGILGYELINEPWIGDKWQIPELRIPSAADIINLQRFYTVLNDAIRKIDNETIIFYEPATGGNYYDAVPVRFTHGPGGDDYNSKQCLSFHIYCGLIQSDVPIDPKLKNLTLAICKGGNKDMLEIRIRDLKRLSTVGYLSEFGAIPMEEIGFELITYMMDLCDKYLLSWAYWLITPSGDFNNPNPEVPYLTRTYAYKIAGNVNQNAFNFTSKEFILNYNVSTNAVNNNMVTNIYFSTKWQYPNGYNYTISCNNNCVNIYINETLNVISLTHITNIPNNEPLEFTLVAL